MLRFILSLKSRTRVLVKVLACLARREYRSALLQHRVAAGVEHEPILRAARPDLVIDIGANKGQFSLAARRVLPAAHILAFEPLPGPAERFRQLFMTDSAVQLHQVAIGPSAGAVVMNISRREDSSSLLPIGQLQSELFPGTRHLSTTEVQVRRLGDVIDGSILDEPQVFLKLDVQGFELQCLEGCSDLLSKCDDIYVEASFVELYEGQAMASDVIRYLDGHGFVLRGVQNLSYSQAGESVQADFWFRRRDRSAR